MPPYFSQELLIRTLLTMLTPQCVCSPTVSQSSDESGEVVEAGEILQKASQTASSLQRRELPPATPSSSMQLDLPEVWEGKPEQEALQRRSLPALANEQESELLASNVDAAAAAQSSREQQPVSLPAGKPPGSAPSQQQDRSRRVGSISEGQLRSDSENKRVAGDERRRPGARSRNSPQRGRAADYGHGLAQAKSRGGPDRGRHAGNRVRDRSRDSPECGRRAGSRSNAKRARSRESPQRGHRGEHKPDSAAERLASQTQREPAAQVSAILQLLSRVTLTTIRKCVADFPS